MDSTAPIYPSVGSGVPVLGGGPGLPPGTVAYLSVTCHNDQFLDEKGVRDLIAALEARLPVAPPVRVLAADLKPGMVLAAVNDRITGVVPDGRDIRITLESGFTCAYIPELPFDIQASSI